MLRIIYKNLNTYCDHITVNMKNDNQEMAETVVQIPEQILKQAVSSTRKLEEERQAAENSRNDEDIKNKLMERAEVVAELPEKVSQAASLIGLRVPDDEMAILYSQGYCSKSTAAR